MGFPLARHGQGTQSISVLSVFQAYIDVFLKPTFETETDAIFTIEEPEAHLHPQVTRALANTLQQLSGQKIISSHSPYFIQEVPLSNIRLFRRVGAGAVVLFVKRHFSTAIPNDPKVAAFCEKPTNALKYKYDAHFGCLSLEGIMERKEYVELLQIYPGKPEVHQCLKRLCEESQLYLTDDELQALEVYVKRIRGEILFARGWLLCEGQSEYVLLRFFAKLLDKSLDDYGISVIDFQNNGSPGAFVSLARTYQIPWTMICDGDQAGSDFAEQVKNRGVESIEFDRRVSILPSSQDLEMFLIRNGFISECCNVIRAQGITLPDVAAPDFEETLADALRRHKGRYPFHLVQELIRSNADATRVPPTVKSLIEKLVEEVS